MKQREELHFWIFSQFLFALNFELRENFQGFLKFFSPNKYHQAVCVYCMLWIESRVSYARWVLCSGIIANPKLDTLFLFFCSLFDTLRNEARVMEGLHTLGIEGLSLHNILKLNIQPSETDYAVDIRSPAIAVSIYLNGPEASGQVPYHCLICVLSKIYKCLCETVFL